LPLLHNLQLLKKGGFIGIADFFLKGNYDDCLSPLFRRVRAVESLLHKNWYVVVWCMRCLLNVLAAMVHSSGHSRKRTITCCVIVLRHQSRLSCSQLQCV
jgi:hypothetical protein